MITVKGPVDHVVVVGAGLAGLAATLHLLGAGRRVTVVERDSGPGGRAGLLESGGYRIDTGPTVLTMPDLVEEAFAAVGDRLADRLELIPLDPAYRARFADGTQLDVHTDGAAMEAAVEQFAGARQAVGYRRLRRWLERLYRVQMRRFIDANFDSPLQLAHPDLARLAALGGFGRLDARIGHFVSDERLRRVFSFQALYAGVPPARALAAYAVIAYMDTIAGCTSPRAACTRCRVLADSAAEAGAAFRYGQTVTRLERSGDRVTAVVTDQERIPCDAVVLTPICPSPTDCSAAPPPSPPSAPLALCGDPARGHGPHLAGSGAPHHLVRRGLEEHLPRTHPHRGADVGPLAPHHPAHRDRPHARPARQAPPLRAGALPEHRGRAGRTGVAGAGAPLPGRAARRAGAP
ncbi:phytoene desaturase family protein [Streptomyces microflavus]